MHAPDGLLNIGTAVATGGISAGCVMLALRKTGDDLESQRIPLAGVTAAFLFAAQMLNFPVGVGTSGHILGAALAAILLGPYLGSLSSVVVVVVQAFVFADGGVTALGYNVLNLAVVPAFGGYGLYILVRRIFPSTQKGVVLSTAFASAGSVLLAAVAFSVEWLFGATVPIPFDTVFGAMVGVHLLIAIAEGLICAAMMSAILKARPDIVFGAQDLGRIDLPGKGFPPDNARKPGVVTGGSPLQVRTLSLAVLSVSVVLAAVGSQFASGMPDGLERVAIDTGMSPTEEVSLLDGVVFADYATSGVGNPLLSLTLAGSAGVFVVSVTAFGMLRAARLMSRKSISASA